MRIRIAVVCVMLAGVLSGIALADTLGAGGNYGLIEGASAPTSVSATAVGTCADGTVLYDTRGILSCGSYTTTNPTAVQLSGGDCSSSPVQDPTCVPGDAIVTGGLDTRTITGITDLACDGTDTFLVRVCLANTSTTPCTLTTLTHGTHFTCNGTDDAASNLLCAASIRSAIAAISGVESVGCPETSGACSTTTVGIQFNRLTVAGAQTTQTGGCGSIAQVIGGSSQIWSDEFGISSFRSSGEVGYIQIQNSTTGFNSYNDGFSIGPYNNDVYMINRETGSIITQVGASTCMTFNSTCQQTTNMVYTGALDLRGAISNGASNVNISDSVDISGTVFVSGSGFIYGDLWRTTASTSITVGTGQSGYVFSNDAATVRADFTLPDAPAAGGAAHWRFVVMDTDGVKILASTSDTIYKDAVATTTHFCSTTLGSTALCYGIKDEVWICETSGTWTIDGCP